MARPTDNMPLNIKKALLAVIVWCDENGYKCLLMKNKGKK